MRYPVWVDNAKMTRGLRCCKIKQSDNLYIAILLFSMFSVGKFKSYLLDYEFTILRWNRIRSAFEFECLGTYIVKIQINDVT